MVDSGSHAKDAEDAKEKEEPGNSSFSFPDRASKAACPECFRGSRRSPTAFGGGFCLLRVLCALCVNLSFSGPRLQEPHHTISMREHFHLAPGFRHCQLITFGVAKHKEADGTQKRGKQRIIQ